MKSYLLLCFLAIILNATSYAQTYFTLSEKLINSSFTVFSPMIDRDFPEMNEGVFQIRPGIKVIKNRWAFNAHASYFLSNDQNLLKNKSATFYGHGLSLSTQYHFIDWKSFKLQPSIEIGIRKYYLDYIETVSRGSFPIIKEKITVFSFTGIGMYGDIGIGIEKIYDLKNRKFGVGFGVGYRLDYGTWQLSDPIPIKNSFAHQNGLFLNVNLLVALKRNHR